MKLRIVKLLFALFLVALTGCNSRDTNDSLIVGKWKVADSEMLPFGHISFCENLTINSVFEFSSKGDLKVFVNDKTGSHCNQYQTYKVNGQSLQMTEADMVFRYGIVKLTKDSLVLNSPYLSREMRLKTELTFSQLDSIQKKGFNITLLKTGEK